MSQQLTDIARYLISKDIDIFEPDMLTPIKKLCENEAIILADAARFLEERNKAQKDLIDQNKSWEEFAKKIQDERWVYLIKLNKAEEALKKITRGKGNPVVVAKNVLKKIGA